MVGTIADIGERNKRLQRLRASMETEQLDALIIAGKGHWWTGRGYFRYLTDFHLWGHDGLILLPLAGEPALSLTSAAVAERVAMRGWITDVRGDYDIAPSIVDLVKKRGLQRGRIGLVGVRFIMSGHTIDLLRAGLPDVTFVDADRLFDKVKARKSPLEVQQNRELWTVAKSAMERFAAVVQDGASERELAAETLKVIYSHGARDHLVMVNGQILEDRPVRLDDVLAYHMEICGESGHWCELTVTLAYRDPTPEELRLMETELLAYEELRKMARPGRTTLKEMATTFETILREAGWALEDRVLEHYDFHGHGLDVIEWPRYSPVDERHDTVLEEGMQFSYHPKRPVTPGVRPPGINEDIVITPSGAERLSGGWDLHWRVMR